MVLRKTGEIRFDATAVTSFFIFFSQTTQTTAKTTKRCYVANKFFIYTISRDRQNNKMGTARKEKQGTTGEGKVTKNKDFRMNQWFVREVQGKEDRVTYQLSVRTEQGEIRNKLRILTVTNKRKPLRAVLFRTQNGSFLVDIGNAEAKGMPPELKAICANVKTSKAKKQDLFIGKWKSLLLCFVLCFKLTNDRCPQILAFIV